MGVKARITHFTHRDLRFLFWLAGFATIYLLLEEILPVSPFFRSKQEKNFRIPVWDREVQRVDPQAAASAAMAQIDAASKYVILFFDSLLYGNILPLSKPDPTVSKGVSTTACAHIHTTCVY